MHQVIELPPLQMEVTRLVLQQAWGPICDQRTKAQVPPEHLARSIRRRPWQRVGPGHSRSCSLSSLRRGYHIETISLSHKPMRHIRSRICQCNLHADWFPEENSNNTYDYQDKWAHRQCCDNDPTIQGQGLKYSVHYYKEGSTKKWLCLEILSHTWQYLSQRFKVGFSVSYSLASCS